MPAENEHLSFDDPGIPAERQFYTLGFIAQMLGQPPHFVVSLARDAGVQPAYAHNGVPTFDGKAVERMAEHMRVTCEFAAREAAAAANN